MDKFCRTCLRISENYVPLYENKSLLNKIETLCSIQVVQSEEYPSKICEECVKNVNFCYNFRKVVINTDKDISERLNTLQKAGYKCKPRRANLDCSKENIEEIDQVSVKDEFEVPCEYLEKNTDSQSDSEIRERCYKLVDGYKIYTCKECSLTFNSRYAFYSHKKKKHVSQGICNICGMTLRADNLRKHIKMHNDTPKKCDECGKLFKNSESLRSHLIMHRGLVFTCEICGKTSKLKSEHTRHLKQHIDPEHRKTQCSLCGKKVRHMQKHMLSHTGERPYVCTFCEKGFSSPYALKVHTRRHTNERPFLCSHCPSTFSQKVSLTTHLRSKHSVAT